MEINWKTPNLRITEPDEDEDFDGKDLEIVTKNTKFIKRTLKSMGIKHKDDLNSVIDKIKILISGANINDVWDKDSTDEPVKKIDWN